MKLLAGSAGKTPATVTPTKLAISTPTANTVTVYGNVGSKESVAKCWAKKIEDAEVWKKLALEPMKPSSLKAISRYRLTKKIRDQMLPNEKLPELTLEKMKEIVVAKFRKFFIDVKKYFLAFPIPIWIYDNRIYRNEELHTFVYNEVINRDPSQRIIVFSQQQPYE
ncbi:unnamed protein product [Caenorhabditis bovis]|uniref:Uncharacterized protein n=1 Tax=Caenorhabditis bovis TaxID=2654633 RepID=A0A8S1EMT2_9PELO|nr:unnamed protein product [Caenorhabditis bovis]